MSIANAITEALSAIDDAELAEAVRQLDDATLAAVLRDHAPMRRLIAAAALQLVDPAPAPKYRGNAKPSAPRPTEALRKERSPSTRREGGTAERALARIRAAGSEGVLGVALTEICSSKGTLSYALSSLASQGLIRWEKDGKGKRWYAA